MYRNAMTKIRACVQRVNHKVMAAGGLALASALPYAAYADGDAIDTAISNAITRATNVGTAVVAGYFTIWAVFLLLKAKKG